MIENAVKPGKLAIGSVPIIVERLAAYLVKYTNYHIAEKDSLKLLFVIVRNQLFQIYCRRLVNGYLIKSSKKLICSAEE